MRTVRDASFDLLAANGINYIFGNPGSNELPFLAGIPEGMEYILGLHEGVVLAMADGYAQMSGQPAFVNLHSAAGTGNAMGALVNSVYTHSPLIVTSGQQVRDTVGQEVMLANMEATNLPRPLVKWSGEPLAATDVPRALAEAFHRATTAPCGPVYLSVPYDDWARPVDPTLEPALTRRVRSDSPLGQGARDEILALLRAAERPCLVLGPDIDSALANDDAVRMADALDAEVWVAPSAGRCPFPTVHPAFRGVLPASVADIKTILSKHDVVLVAGAPVFRYHQYQPDHYLTEGTRLLHLTEDPSEAARAPIGDAYVGSIGSTMTLLADALPDTGAWAGDGARPKPPTYKSTRKAVHPGNLLKIVSETMPDDAVYVAESTSTVDFFWEQVKLRQPRSYFFPAAGALGFGMAAAVGVQMAAPERRTVALVGDGSANYAISALWSAAQYRVPVIFIILKNGTYGALRGFGKRLATGETPGMDLPDLDFVKLAEGYGVPAQAVTTATQLRAALNASIAAEGPTLIEVTTSFDK